MFYAQFRNSFYTIGCLNSVQLLHFPKKTALTINLKNFNYDSAAANKQSCLHSVCGEETIFKQRWIIHFFTTGLGWQSRAVSPFMLCKLHLQTISLPPNMFCKKVSFSLMPWFCSIQSMKRAWSTTQSNNIKLNRKNSSPLTQQAYNRSAYQKEETQARSNDKKQQYAQQTIQKDLGGQYSHNF